MDNKEDVERLYNLHTEFVQIDKNDVSLNEECLLLSLKQRLSDDYLDNPGNIDMEDTVETAKIPTEQ